jgi:molybdopterin converting factor small subunit
MEVRVRLNGALAASLGHHLQVTLPEGATVGELRARLAQDHPTLAEPFTVAVPIVAGRLAGEDDRLDDEAEVAFLLPVSGGVARRLRLVEGSG